MYISRSEQSWYYTINMYCNALYVGLFSGKKDGHFHDKVFGCWCFFRGMARDAVKVIHDCDACHLYIFEGLC